MRKILFKVYGHYCYLTEKQFNNIYDIVCCNEDAVWHYSSHIIGSKENIERNRRIQNYLEKNFREEYYKFNFYDKDAVENILEILFSYSSLTNIVKIFRADNVDYGDLWEEAVTGPNIKKIKVKIYEKIFFGLFGTKDTGSSITINIDNVDRVYGELQNFMVESKNFNVRFTKDNVNIVYK